MKKTDHIKRRCRSKRTGILSYTVSGNVKWYKHFGKQFGTFLKN